MASFSARATRNIPSSPPTARGPVSRQPCFPRRKTPECLSARTRRRAHRAPSEREAAPGLRQLLECASPLALWHGARSPIAPEDWRSPKRWREFVRKARVAGTILSPESSGPRHWRAFARNAPEETAGRIARVTAPAARASAAMCALSAAARSRAAPSGRCDCGRAARKTRTLRAHPTIRGSAVCPRPIPRG